MVFFQLAMIVLKTATAATRANAKLSELERAVLPLHLSVVQQLYMVPLPR
jgi:hypothetical protein